MRGCLFCFTVEVTGNKNAKRRPEGRRFSHKTYKTRKTCFLSCRRANRLADGKPPVGWPTGGWPTGVLPEAALRLHRVVVVSSLRDFALTAASCHCEEERRSNPEPPQVEAFYTGAKIRKKRIVKDKKQFFCRKACRKRKRLYFRGVKNADRLLHGLTALSF